MDGAQVGVLEETDQVSLAGLLQGHDGRALEAQIGLEVLGDFTDKTLEGQLADEKLGGLLVTTDLTESDGSGPVTVRFLHASCGRGGLPRSLGGKLLARSLSSGGFTGGLFCSGHSDDSVNEFRVNEERRASFAFILCWRKAPTPCRVAIGRLSRANAPLAGWPGLCKACLPHYADLYSFHANGRYIGDFVVP